MCCQDNYYIPCTASMCTGMAGGPIVSLEKPDELYVIVCASFDGDRADCDIVRSAYEWAVS